MIAPKNNPKIQPQKPRHNVLKWVVPIVVVLVVCVLRFLLHPGETTPNEPTPNKPRKPRIAAIPKRSTPSPAIKVATTNVVESGKRYENGIEVVSSTIMTNTNGITVERPVLANGKTKKKVRHPKPIFEFSSDDLIATAISVKPGASMPPLPIDKNIDKEFAQSLLSPIRINEDDSDEVKEIKPKVMETRAYLAEEIKRGGSVYQALMDHQNEQNRIADNRLMAIQEMQKVRTEMGEEAANEFRDMVNESFRIRGIPEIGKKPTEGEN